MDVLLLQVVRGRWFRFPKMSMLEDQFSADAMPMGQQAGIICQ